MNIWFVLTALIVMKISYSLKPLKLRSFGGVTDPSLLARSIKSAPARRIKLSVADNDYVTRDELLRNVLDTPVRAELMLTSDRIEKLRNRYIGYRHGQSKANVAGIISSNYEIGCFVGEGDHGLTDLGKSQAHEATMALLTLVGKERFESDDVIFVSSPFSRAKQTAEETLQELLTTWDLDVPMEIDEGLRERFFGDFDQQDLIYYNRVWPVDLVDSENTRHGVESVAQLCERIIKMIENLEEKYENKVCILTSHADTLQIAQTLFSGEDPRSFSQHRFKNCEARELIDPYKRLSI